MHVPFVYLFLTNDYYDKLLFSPFSKISEISGCFSFQKIKKTKSIFQFGTDPGLPQELRRLQHLPVKYRCFHIV